MLRLRLFCYLAEVSMLKLLLVVPVAAFSLLLAGLMHGAIAALIVRVSAERGQFLATSRAILEDRERALALLLVMPSSLSICVFIVTAYWFWP